MTITSSNETPVVIPATDVTDEDLVGILTAPNGNANGAAVLSLWGGGGVPAFGKNQARVRLSRELAARGFHALRFSYTGVGESGGLVRDPDIGNEWSTTRRRAALARVPRLPAHRRDRLVRRRSRSARRRSPGRRARRLALCRARSATEGTARESSIRLCRGTCDG